MKVFFILLFSMIFLGCTTSTNNSRKVDSFKKKIPPPAPANEERMCDSLKALAYHDINRGEITIVFNDTIRNNKLLFKHFISILKNKFGFSYFRLNDVGFQTVSHKYCVQPIMDSTIAAKYGENAKDSIIKEAYRLAEIEYQKVKRSKE